MIDFISTRVGATVAPAQRIADRNGGIPGHDAGGGGLYVQVRASSTVPVELADQRGTIGIPSVRRRIARRR